MRTKTLSGILLWLVLSLILPSATPAAVVGRLTHVEGQVDLLKKGRLPAIPLKPNDGVETGDVVRTKSLSKAQITFIDDTVLTISPGSRIAIEKYMVAGGKRSAVLKMFQGVALAVVSKIFKAKEPDFVIKTNTAIMGVRGTKVGLLLYPNYSEILTFEGRTEVRNLFLEIPGVIELKGGHGTRVTRGLPPTMAFVVSHGDFERFMQHLTTGLTARLRGQDSKPGSSDSGDQLARGSSGSGELMLVSIVPKVPPPELKKPDEETVQAVAEEETTPPPEPPPPAPPPSPSLPQDYVVNWSSTGQYTMVKGAPGAGDPHDATYSGSLTLTNGSQVNFTILAQDPSSPGNFNQSSSGTITWTVNGDLKLIDGTSSYSGTVSAEGKTTGGTEFTFTLDAIYSAANGKLTLTSVDSVKGGYVSNSTSGDFTQPTDPSHKITEGTAQIISLTPISYTSTAVATSTTAGTTTSISPTGSATSALSPAVSMDAAVVSSALTPLPLPSTLSTAGPPGPTAAGPPGQVVSAMAPGQAVVAGPPGQAVSAAAPGHAVAASAVGPAMAVTPAGVAAPGLQNQPAALNNVHVPPGLSKAPGQAGNPPGNANGHSK